MYNFLKISTIPSPLPYISLAFTTTPSPIGFLLWGLKEAEISLTVSD